MKNLKKFSLHNVGDVMQDSEMKKIFGGYTDAYSSPWCRQGELLFSCKANITFAGGYNDEYIFDAGAVCAKNKSEACRMVTDTFYKQGVVDGGVAVSCN